MAATVAAMSGATALCGPLAARSSSFRRTALNNAVKMGAPIRRSGVVCMADNPLQDAIDKTKVNVTVEGVKQNMADDSEKASVFGTKPVAGTTLGRPELERRPETGDRSLGSVMAFDGPAPETINGRLAMVGCLWAFFSEAFTGQRVIDQINYPGSPGLFFLLVLSQVLIWASLVPIFNGESPDSRKSGPFDAKAERWNGRLAAVGFAGILINEWARNAPVFPHIW